MTRRIPDEVVEQVRNSVDIVDVVGEYVQLKKQGRNYFGLCPFHGESTPSFSVAPEKQIYHCFGCGEGGNAITFLMNIEGIGFSESIGRLAKKTGMDMSAYETDRPKEVVPDTNVSMLEAHDYMAKYYHHILVNTTEGEVAREYLLSRGFTKEILTEFQIGYAMDSWDTAKRILEQRGFNLALMEKSGLLAIREQDGSYFDRFRGRIMFPLHNLQGKIVGFSGRAMGNDTPKYLNTPESPLFSKGKLLYNYHVARPAMRQTDQVVLFEGFADVIAASKSGVRESVATMGTALTLEQAMTLKRTTDNVLICYDGDTAGIEASLKAAEVLDRVGCQIKIAVLPEGMDPDDYVNKYGEEKFRTHIISQGLSLTDFKLQILRRGKNLQDENEKLSYLREVLAEVAKLTKPLDQEVYLKNLAKDFDLSIETLEQELQELVSKQPVKPVTRQPNLQRAVSKSRQRPAYEVAERHLLAYMLGNEDILHLVQEQLPGLFHMSEHSEIIIHLSAYYEEGNTPDIGKFMEGLPAHLRNIVSEISLILVNPEIKDEAIKDYIQTIKKFEWNLSLEAKTKEMTSAEKRQDWQTVIAIQQEVMELRNLLKNS